MMCEDDIKQVDAWFEQHTEYYGTNHVDNEYFVCGSSVANKNKRVIVPTPFGGYAKCYDCGYVGNNHFDMYVNW